MAWGETDTGLQREHNEDKLILRPDLGLFAVADGMGGHHGGAQASKIAVTVLEKHVSEAFERGHAISGDLLLDGTRMASTDIFDLAEKEPPLMGMGTTLTSLLVHNGTAMLSHVGDSRAYSFRDGELKQLTEDHSWVHEQTKAGFLTFDQARTSKFRHVITRSVGFERNVKADLIEFPLLMGDCFVICSDGLTGGVEPKEISQILSERNYEDAPAELIKLANAKGGDDNITVIVGYAANDK